MIKRMTEKLHIGQREKEQTHSARASASSQVTTSTTSTASTSFSTAPSAQTSFETCAPEVTIPAAYAARPTATLSLSDFSISRTLGTGSFGRVHLARSVHNGAYFAIKALNKSKIVRLSQVEHTNNEQRLLSSVKHPFIVNLWGCFQDSTSLFMVMDFVSGGELFSLLRRSRRFPDPVAKFYGAEVALGLRHLHRLDIIYRDLKPENILLDMDGHIKIADFGFAKHVPTVTYTLCGTPDYLAPEIVKQQRYNKSVDWYSLGVLLFEMLTGLPPFYSAEEDSNPSRLYARILEGPSRIVWPSNIYPHARDIIMKLLDADPTRRLGNLWQGSGDIFAHPYFTEVDWVRLQTKQVSPPYIPSLQGAGDASAFERYPEEVTDYGGFAHDPHGVEFPDFAYTRVS